MEISLGFQWTLLQSVAWVVMLLDRNAEMGWVQAIKTTLDVHHPCAVCQVVRKGRSKQQQSTLFFSFAETDRVLLEGCFKLPVPETASAERAGRLE